jgi:Laminin B (Domain IV)
MRTVCLATLLVVCAALEASASTIAISTFDTDADGWRIGDFFDTTGDIDPAYVASGGNPGGFIRTSDLFSWNAFQAPAGFIGDQSAAYGGSLNLDMQVLTHDGLNYSMVVIGDGVTSLQFRTAPPGTSWTSYSIPLLASAGWEIANGGPPGPAATESQLQDVLSGLTFLNLDADWQTGDDRVDLDNVELCSRTGCDVRPPTGVAEPSSLVLFGTAALGVFRTSRRRNASRS